MSEPAWLRRGIVPTPERDEREQEARAIARDLAAEMLTHIEPGAPLEPAKAVAVHVRAETLLRVARDHGVVAESFRLWIVAAVIEGWR